MTSQRCVVFIKPILYCIQYTVGQAACRIGRVRADHRDSAGHAQTAGPEPDRMTGSRFVRQFLRVGQQCSGLSESLITPVTLADLFLEPFLTRRIREKHNDHTSFCCLLCE